MSEEEKSKEKAKLQATIDKLESKLGKNGKLGKAAYDANMAKLKEYGYTENMVKAGISPGFFANLMVNSNEINWNSFESSVLNDTSRKDLAQGFNAMITDRNNPDYVRLYKIGEKDLTDRVETTEWMGISGADPQNEKSGQTPVFSTNPKLGVLTVTYRDQRGKPVTYAVKKDDINRHPGFSEKLIQGIDEEHEIYELMSDPKKFFNMPEEKRDKYTKGLWKGLSEEERAKQMHNACAAFICAARPDIITVSDLNEAMKSLTSTEASVIILRLSMMAYLEGHNHDMMNVNVKNLLWGKNYNATTSARAQLFESWMSNN